MIPTYTNIPTYTCNTGIYMQYLLILWYLHILAIPAYTNVYLQVPVYTYMYMHIHAYTCIYMPIPNREHP